MEREIRMSFNDEDEEKNQKEILTSDIRRYFFRMLLHHDGNK